MLSRARSSVLDLEVLDIENDVLDIEAVAKVAHEVGVPLLIDNTVATPYLIQPLKHGADFVVHSATKYLGGHGTSVAGAIIDGGTFDVRGDLFALGVMMCTGFAAPSRIGPSVTASM